MARAPVVLVPFHPERPGVFAPVRVDPAGLTGPTPKAARGPRWRRTSTGRYVPADVDATLPAQRIVEAAGVMTEHMAVTGWAALHWWGARYADALLGSVPREIVIAASGAANLRHRPGVVPSKERLDPREAVTHHGLRVTTAVRSVCFEMRYAPDVRRAVVALDMAAYSDLVSLAELQEYADLHSGWTGIPQCRAALPLADENSWSPPETLMRLAWVVDAGFPRPLCNVPLFDRDGQHLGTPDLLDPSAGVIGEYDGLQHLRAGTRASDVRREARFRAAQLEPVVMTAPDLSDTRSFVNRLSEAYDRARARSGPAPAWTMTPPAWWVSTSTVARRRALDGRNRQYWLAYRAP